MEERKDRFELDLPRSNLGLSEEMKKQPNIRVYLASALTGREVDKDFDDRVRAEIRNVFLKVSLHKIPYLVTYQVYDPEEVTAPGSAHRPEEVFHIDFKELVSSDFALFYVNAGSLGMGIERQIAAMASIPSCWISKRQDEVSRMFQGTFGGSLFTLEFNAIDELAIKLSNAIAQFGPELFEKAMRRREVIQALQDHKIPRRIFRKRIALNLTIETLARETGIQPFWWEKVQRDESGLLAASTFTPIVFFQLAEILQGRWEVSEKGIPSFYADTDLSENLKVSLDNLYDAYICRENPVDDVVLLSLWNDYLAKSQKTHDILWENGKVFSKEEWIVKIEGSEKARLVQVLELDNERLNEADRKSLSSLYEFSKVVSHISNQTIVKLWKHFKKNIEGKAAARGGGSSRTQPFLVDDWRNLFNHLHFND